jgi:hypothetical protein
MSAEGQNARWMSYDEMADVMRLTRDSAKVLARRKRWPRRPGNDGRTRIGVPEEEIAARSNPANDLGNNPENEPANDLGNDPERNRPVLAQELLELRVLNARLEERVEGLNRLLEEAHCRRDALQAERAALRQELDQECAAAAQERAAMQEAVATQVKALTELVEALRRDRQAAKPRFWWPWRRTA